MLDNAYKPYPCGVVLFPVIDACLDILAKHKPATASVAAIEVRGHPLLRERTDRPDVQDGRLSRVSLQHAVAAALVQGAGGLMQFTDACVQDPAVRAMRAKVTADDDPGMTPDEAIVTVRLQDGSALREHVKVARGTPGRPMSDTELDAKVTELAAAGAPFVDMPVLIAAVRGIEQQANATGFLRLAVP
jgi:2-methylcitrate dehydratase PrpD